MTTPVPPLRPSRVLAKLRAGEVVSCTKLNLSDPRVVEIAALAGLDCVWLDLEHVANNIRDIENAVRAAKAYNCDALVRVPRGSYSDLVRPLEVDAAGIMVPHVMNGDDARQIIHQTRFHPLGLRPLDGGNTDGAYCTEPLQDYIRHANEQRFVILQIEDPEAVNELDAIASVPGVDMIFFGPGDYSHALGIPGQMDDPRIDQARQAVARAAQKHNIFAGTVTGAAGIDRCVQMGYRFLSVGADVVALSSAFRETAAAFTGVQAKGTDSLYSANT
ncbi:HpcH/HpaI aldolase/citrate lyase family protein [Phycisphaerales bacterium AB-hyl4]|uniref:HpcH/HpaI aldolase/citrate lyase family protein n=1 Tax=Natronomicrosphaera hydrolytica TaxID=3242702 RepID=A0ABV4U5Y5_9BACT